MPHDWLKSSCNDGNCFGPGTRATPTPTVGPGITQPPPPPTGTVEILIYSAITKQDWLEAVTTEFNAQQHRTGAGQLIVVKTKHSTSGGSMQEILDDQVMLDGQHVQPALWSPGDHSWVDQANQKWQDLHGLPLASQTCPATVYAPLGITMWEPMAKALGWPSKPITWDTIVALAADPKGWERYGHPEWEQFKFGHPHPKPSNAGMLFMAALAYDTLGQTSGLTPQQIKSAAVEQAARKIELHTYHYGIQSRALIELMNRKGPDYLHAVVSFEAETVKANRQYSHILTFPLAFIFPAQGVSWTEQPTCILDGVDWVSAAQVEAAGIYRDFLLSRDRDMHTIEFGLRPIDLNVPLQCPICLASGTDPSVTPNTVPALASPSGEAAAALIDLFYETKKKQTVIVVLDRSGSMDGDKLKNAKAATVEFIKNLDSDDWVSVVAFNSKPIALPVGRVGDVEDDLINSVEGLFPEGGTALYDSICQAIEQANALREKAEAAGDKRLYAIVVLSDGDDTASEDCTESDLMNIFLPSGEDVEGIRVFTIAYGEEANKDLLLRIANRTNAKFYEAAPDTIQKVLEDIIAQ